MTNHTSTIHADLARLALRSDWRSIPTDELPDFIPAIFDSFVESAGSTDPLDNGTFSAWLLVWLNEIA